MKIFLSFLQSEEKHPIPAYTFWEYYIKNGIEEAGHQWAECPDVDWAFGLVPNSKTVLLNWRQDAWNKTLAWLKKNPADLFLSYLYPHQIDIAAIAEIKKSGTPCVNFYCDHLRDFKKLPIEFSVFDLNWVPEYKALELYQKAGYPYINLPMPIWVNPSLRIFQPEKNEQVTFIGSKDIQRRVLLEEILSQDQELPLFIYGNGWEELTISESSLATNYPFYKKLLHQFTFLGKQGIVPYIRKIRHKHYVTPTSTILKSKSRGILDFEHYNELTCCSMITMGINRYPSFHFPFFHPNTYSRLRDIEAPMLGACYLTEWTDGIDNLYNIGQDIETYRNVEEFIEKINELKNDSQKRKNLKINGQKRALEAHTIPSSLREIICTLNL